MNVLLIHLPSPQHQFSICYSLAFVVAMVLLIYEGHKRKFPMLSWILIISFSQILFIIGTKLFTLSTAEWNSMLSDLELVPAPKKELLGGMLLLWLGLIIGKVWMKFRHSFPDAFAIAIPLALTFSKAGCFFAGCCFGKPCDLPWAVSYPVKTLPHYHHFQQTLIGAGDIFSLPVHPVQLYELSGALLVVILVIALQRKWRREGSSFLFSVSSYLVVRFVVEFFKDPFAHTSGGTMAGALNQTQWGILALFPLLVLLLVFRERRLSFSQPSVPDSVPQLTSVLSFVSFSALLIFTMRKWFSAIEILTILLFFVLAAILTLKHILKNHRQFRYRLMYAVFLFIPFLLMGQALPSRLNDSVTIRKSISVGVGFGSGNFDNSFEKYTGEGCDRIENTSYFNQKYSLSAAKLNIRNENLTLSREENFGFNVLFGRHTETFLMNDAESDATGFSGLPGNEPQRESLLGINPYYKFDTRWFGLGAGFHAGRLSYTYNYKEEEGYGKATRGRKMISFYPQVYLRIGPRDIAYLDYHLADHFPSALPAYKQMIGIGSGFGSLTGLSASLGTLIGSTRDYNDWDFWEFALNGVYFTGYIPLSKGFSLEPLVLFSNSEYESQNLDFRFSLGLHYEWHHKTITRLPVVW